MMFVRSKAEKCHPVFFFLDSIDLFVAERARCWPVLLECVRTAGQRHVYFNKGWAELCSANGLFIGKSAQLARWKEGVSPSHVALVTLSIVQAHEK